MPSNLRDDASGTGPILVHGYNWSANAVAEPPDPRSANSRHASLLIRRRSLGNLYHRRWLLPAKVPQIRARAVVGRGPARFGRRAYRSTLSNLCNGVQRCGKAAPLPSTARSLTTLVRGERENTVEPAVHDHRHARFAGSVQHQQQQSKTRPTRTQIRAPTSFQARYK